MEPPVGLTESIEQSLKDIVRKLDAIAFYLSTDQLRGKFNFERPLPEEEDED